jgi:hypothetical protein
MNAAICFNRTVLNRVWHLFGTLLLGAIALAVVGGIGYAQEAVTEAVGSAAATSEISGQQAAGESAADDETAEAEDAAESATDTAEGDAEQEKPQPLPFRQRPYRVLVSMGFSGESRLALLDPAATLKATQQAVRRMYGQMWDAQFEINTWLLPATSSRLGRVEVTDILPESEDGDDEDEAESISLYPEEELDKVFLVTVEVQRTSFRITCREYDSRCQELTPIRTETIHDVRAIAEVSARLIRDSFRPNLMFTRKFEDEDGKEYLELEVQAGEYPALDPTADQVLENDVLRPFLRSMDRRNPDKLRQLQSLALTYIRVTEVDREVARGTVKGVLISHTPFAPFGGRGRRLQQMALRQRPSADSSRVRLVLRTRPDKPLVSHRTALVYKLRYRDEDEIEQVRMLSDRNGELEISVHPDYPSFWIYVYSGSILLARVPYAPGMLPFDVIELPDDSIRLGVEGELQLLQDELIDAVAMREVYFSMASKAASAGNVDDLDAHLESYQNVPGKDHFLEVLSLVEIPAVDEARAKRSRSQERFVQRLCGNIRDSLNLFFSEEKRLARLEEIQKLRVQAERGGSGSGQ